MIQGKVGKITIIIMATEIEYNSLEEGSDSYAIEEGSDSYAIEEGSDSYAIEEGSDSYAIEEELSNTVYSSSDNTFSNLEEDEEEQDDDEGEGESPNFSYSSSISNHTENDTIEFDLVDDEDIIEHIPHSSLEDIIEHIPHSSLEDNSDSITEMSTGTSEYEMSTGASEYEMSTGASEYEMSTGASEYEMSTGASEYEMITNLVDFIRHESDQVHLFTEQSIDPIYLMHQMDLLGEQQYQFAQSRPSNPLFDRFKFEVVDYRIPPYFVEVVDEEETDVCVSNENDLNFKCPIIESKSVDTDLICNLLIEISNIFTPTRNFDQLKDNIKIRHRELVEKCHGINHIKQYLFGEVDKISNYTSLMHKYVDDWISCSKDKGTLLDRYSEQYTEILDICNTIQSCNPIESQYMGILIDDPLDNSLWSKFKVGDTIIFDDRIVRFTIVGFSPIVEPVCFDDVCYIICLLLDDHVNTAICELNKNVFGSIAPGMKVKMVSTIEKPTEEMKIIFKVFKPIQ
jgi:hypothetical protein